ncbi:Hypothetical protein PHPALM_9320 [Phytophthora palmivora]|uniref:Uncharacterized protein n=1 Tax=Phytophthora palmivora TaxID=4796 RepID=A0A2P4Y7L3_9STRA|nr:Hypothetical protein PHPALM_9320 [Phytophthora palmivora]
MKDIAGEMHNRNVRLKVLSPFQKAVRILQKVYGHQFTTTRMAKAFDIMLDERKAQIFVVMEEGKARDLWLDIQLTGSN